MNMNDYLAYKSTTGDSGGRGGAQRFFLDCSVQNTKEKLDYKKIRLLIQFLRWRIDFDFKRKIL